MAMAGVGVAMQIYGGYLNKRAGDKAARAEQQYQDRVFDYAEKLRRSSMKALSDRKIYGAAEWMFPGLLAPPAMRGGKSVYGGGKGVKVGPKEAPIRDPLGYVESKGLAQPGRPAINQPPPAPLSGPLHAGVDPAQFDPAGSSTDMPTGVEGPHSASMLGGAVPVASGGPPQALNAGGGGDTFGGPHRKSRRARRRARRGRFEQYPGRSAQTYPGELVMQHLQNFLQNPGQLSSATYERAQEQANQGFNMATSQMMGSMTGLGLDPRSGLGLTTQANNILNLAKARNEAARDYSIAQDQLRRADIGIGTEMYQNFLNTIFGLQGARSEAAKGVGVPLPGSPQAAGTGTAAMGSTMSNLGSQVMSAGGGMGAFKPGGGGGGMGGPTGTGSAT